jgi:hypothetical protein
MKTVGKSVNFIRSFALTQFSCQQGSHRLVYKKICSAKVYINNMSLIITIKRSSMRIKGCLFEME